MNPSVHVHTSKVMGFEWIVVDDDGLLARGHAMTAREARRRGENWIKDRGLDREPEWMTPDGPMAEVKRR